VRLLHAGRRPRHSRHGGRRPPGERGDAARHRLAGEVVLESSAIDLETAGGEEDVAAELGAGGEVALIAGREEVAQPELGQLAVLEMRQQPEEGGEITGPDLHRRLADLVRSLVDRMGLALDDQHAGRRPLLLEVQGEGEPGEPAAEDDDVIPGDGGHVLSVVSGLFTLGSPATVRAGRDDTLIAPSRHASAAGVARRRTAGALLGAATAPHCASQTAGDLDPVGINQQCGPADIFAAILDRLIRNEGGAGNLGQLRMRLGRPLGDPAALARAWRRLGEQAWPLGARLLQGLRGMRLAMRGPVDLTLEHRRGERAPGADR
jgi:hypothetical protein